MELEAIVFANEVRLSVRSVPAISEVKLAIYEVSMFRGYRCYRTHLLSDKIVVWIPRNESVEVEIHSVCVSHCQLPTSSSGIGIAVICPLSSSFVMLLAFPERCDLVGPAVCVRQSCI